MNLTDGVWMKLALSRLPVTKSSDGFVLTLRGEQLIVWCFRNVLIAGPKTITSWEIIELRGNQVITSRATAGIRFRGLASSTQVQNMTFPLGLTAL